MKARLTALFALAACGTPPQVSPRMLLSSEGWSEVAPGLDPFEDRPQGMNGCALGGFGAEGGAFEVETGLCPYLTAAQPLAAPIEEGALVTGLVWHLQLRAPEPAEGHFALMIDGHRVHEARIPIPNEAGAHHFAWRAPAAIPSGAAALYHVHNHGQNSWRLSPISVEAP